MARKFANKTKKPDSRKDVRSVLFKRECMEENPKKDESLQRKAQ
jgi:hypothetical protein